MPTQFWRFVAACAGAWVAVSVSATGQVPERVPGRLLVRFASGASDQRAQTAVSVLGGTLGPEIGHTGFRMVRVPPEDPRKPAAAQTLRGMPDVAEVQYDYRLPPEDLPGDSYYSSQWHLATMGCPAAWASVHGDGSAIVAILDTGVDSSHPDLAPVIVGGWNTYDNNPDTSDVYGHGTAVAGTAAASTDNGIGVAGVAWGCSIMPVRISDPDGYGYSSTVSNGLTWAADHGARVANISYGFSNDPVVRAAAKYFSDKGGVVTISAGNSAYCDPAADNPYVLTVSATDSSDALASWSNRGNNVDVCAPGVGIVTTCRGGGYGSWSGTSFSAPATAGVAALVICACPSLTGPEVQQIVKETSDDLGTPGWDAYFAAGRVNADRAVASAQSHNTDKTPPAVTFHSPTNGSKLSGTVVVQVGASDDVAVSSVVLKKDGAVVATFDAAPYNWTYVTTTESAGAHSFTAVASDAAGNSAQATLTVTVDNGDQTPPTVAFTSPSNGATVAGSVTLNVSASDDKGVRSVTLSKDGAVVATLTSSPYRWTYNSSSDDEGAHLFTATARDAAGNQSTASLNLTVNNPDRTAPTVRFSSPRSGATVSGATQIVVTASDNRGVASVEIRKDKVLVAVLTSAPYTWSYDTESDKNGNHAFTATARDAAGNRATASLSLKVNNPDRKPPTVTLTGSVLTGQIGAALALTASATDNVKVTRVQYYVDGVLAGSSTRSPFRVNLNSHKIAVGEHTFYAVAWDAAGNSGVSPSVVAAK